MLRARLEDNPRATPAPMTSKPTFHRPDGDRNGQPPFDGNGQLKADVRGRSIRILVVDDDPAMREMIINYLEGHQLIAMGASGRREMASHLARGDLSLVLLDLSLGEDNGLDLLRDTRSRSDVPVIIITGD